MGYNSTVIVLTDALHQISADKDFGKKLADAIGEVTRGKPVDIASGGHCNVATVIETHHADHTVVVAMGGNYGSVFGSTYGWSHHEKKDQIRILRDIASEFGFNLATKRKRKKQVL